MVINYNCKKLEDPKKFFHSHASGNENIIYTSGMVSRKDDLTGLNIGVKISASESNNKYVHNIELQFLDIIKQLELICEDLEIEKSDLKDHILESKAYIVDVKRYFKDFNKSYGNWMGIRDNYPARTTIGVDALPSNVVLEMSFILHK